MSPYERITIADALKASFVAKDGFVFKQGDKGDCFYMIMAGEAVALKDEESEIKEVFNYKEGDYFGELALLNDEPRAASIKGKSDLSLASLDINSFKRLMGPAQDILKRNEERYKKFVLNK